MRDHTYMGMRQQLHQPPPSSEPPTGFALLATLAVLAGFFLWAVLGHPTAAERTRALDSVGKTTGVNWR